MIIQFKSLYKIFLFSSLFLCLQLSAAAVEKTVNVTVGSSFTLNPWGDAKSSFSGYTCAATTCMAEDASAFTINTASTTKTRFQAYSSTYEDGFYSTYKVQALKTGTYIIHGRGTCYKYSFNSTYVGSIDVVYHVVVSEKPVVTAIVIENNLTLTIGNSYTFTPVIVQNGATTSLSWSSSNPNVVSVTNTGSITALSQGTSVIKCTASNGVSAQCSVTVNPVLATSVSLNHKEMTLEVGQKTSLAATVLPTNATSKNVTWSSSDPNTVLVGTDGTIVGMKAGNAMITVTTTDGSNKQATCMIEVIPAKVVVESIKLNKTSLSLVKGDTEQLIATVLPSNATNKDVVWSVNNNFVSVDEEGNVTALKAGNAIVNATTTDGTNLTASCEIAVSEKDISSYDNIIYLEPSTCVKGKTITLPLYLKNTAEITAVQFDLLLPNGVDVRKKTNSQTYDIMFNESSDRTDAGSHSISSALQENGSIRVLCYSSSLAVFAGGDGAVLDIPLEVSNDMPSGKYYFSIDNIVLTDKNENKYTIENYSSIINIVSTIPGDPNADGVIDVADIVATANHILGNSIEVFIAEAADLDVDGTIDVADIVGISNLILVGNTSRKVMRKTATQNVDNTSKFEIAPFTMTAGQQSNVITLDLYNSGVEYTAFQLDMSLPEGLSVDMNRRGTAYNLSFNTDADRTDASYHTLSSAKQANGDIRILCYSTTLDIFWGDNGALINIPVTASSDMQAGVYDFYLKNIILTKCDETKILPADYRGSIVVGDGGLIKDIKLYGAYSSETLKDFSTAFSANKCITSLDMTETSIQVDNTSELTTGNPNTLVYINENQLLSNTQNVVIGNVCNNLELTDNMPFNAPKAFTAATASYRRTVSGAGWYSMCLPFAPIVDAGTTVEKFVGVNVDAKTVTFDTEIAPQAYVPYIFNADSKNVCMSGTDVEVAVTPDIIGDGAFIGTLTGVEAPAIDGYFVLKSDGSGFAVATATAYATPFRAVINTMAGIKGIRQLSVIHGGDATGIEVVETDGKDNNDIYNLNGMKVAKAGKGIYIRNGKKYIK